MQATMGANIPGGMGKKDVLPNGHGWIVSCIPTIGLILFQSQLSNTSVVLYRTILLYLLNFRAAFLARIDIRPFIFQQMWVRHPTFKDMVAHSWSEPVYGRPISCLSMKLRRLKAHLKSWNKEFGTNRHMRKVRPKGRRIRKAVSLSNRGDSHRSLLE